MKLLLLFSLIFTISCARHHEVSSTQITISQLGENNLTGTVLQGAKFENGEPVIYFSKVIKRVPFEIDLPVGDWTFFGRAIEGTNEYCALNKTELKNESHEIELIYNSANCNHPTISDQGKQLQKFYFCSDPNSADANGCNGSPTTSLSFKYHIVEVDLSTPRNLNINSNVTISSECYSINFGQADNNIPLSLAGENSYPLHGMIEIFSDANCTNRNSLIKLESFLNSPDSNLQIIEDTGNYFVVIQDSGPCTIDAQCGPNQRCDVGQGTCRSTFGGGCTNQADCMQGNCFQNYCRRLSNNASCTTHEECTSNFCDANNTCQQTTYFFNSLAYKDKTTSGDNTLLLSKSTALQKSPGINSDSEYTYSIWFKTGSKKSGSLWAQKDTRGVPNGQIGLSINGPIFGPASNFNQISFKDFDSTNPNAGKIIFDETIDPNLINLSDSTWHMATISKRHLNDQTTDYRLYVDAIEIASTNVSTTTAPVNNDQQIFLGGNKLNQDAGFGLTAQFIGEMDEFAIWDKGLTQAEINSIYQAERNRDLRLPFFNYQNNQHLKTYVKMARPFHMTNLIDYSRDEQDHTSSMSGTLNPMPANYPNAPPAFVIHSDKMFVRPKFQHLNDPIYNLNILGIVGDNDGDQPATNTLDDNTATFGHTNKINDYYNYFFNESVHLSKIEVINRVGCCPQRFRDINFELSNDGTKVFDFEAENNKLINDQLGVNNWSDLNTPTDLTVDFTTEVSKLSESGMTLERLSLNNRTGSLPKTNHLRIERIQDTISNPNNNPSIQEGDRTLLHFAEIDFYGLTEETSDQFLLECNNGEKDFHESDIDCGGNFCSQFSLIKKCSYNQQCFEDFHCQSHVCVNNKCTQETFSPNIHPPKSIQFKDTSPVDTKPKPKFLVEGDIGNTIEVCSDAQCSNIIHDEVIQSNSHVISLANDLTPGDHLFYFRYEINGKYSEVIGPYHYTYFTPVELSTANMTLSGTQTWAAYESLEKTIDRNLTTDMSTGNQSNNIYENGVLVNQLPQHWYELKFNSERWVSSFKIRNRNNCCTNRITNWNIILYDKHDNEIASYRGLNNNNYFNLNTVQGSNGINDHTNVEFSFHLTGSNTETMGIKKAHLIKKIRITRDRDLTPGITWGGAYGEETVAVNFNEIYIYGKE